MAMDMRVSGLLLFLRRSFDNRLFHDRTSYVLQAHGCAAQMCCLYVASSRQRSKDVFYTAEVQNAVTDVFQNKYIKC